ncbi:MAG: hypothetical protein NVS2B6_05240 [Thermoleophilaceae bacterium]
MTKRLSPLLATLVLAAIAVIAFALPASAALRTFLVRTPTGAVVTVTVNAPAGVAMGDVQGLPGTPIQELTPPPPPPAQSPGPQQSAPAPEPQHPTPPGAGKGQGPERHAGPRHDAGVPSARTPRSRRGTAQPRSGSKAPAKKPNGPKAKAQPKLKARQPGGAAPSSGLGSGVKPSFFDMLPGPGAGVGVPDFVVQNFGPPLALLPMYQAAGIEYGVPWTVLAAINDIETNYGRDVSVSSAGAEGFMQFMPATWKQYGVDANGDGKADPYDPVDAIFAAGRYLRAADAQHDVRKAVFEYNHAGWYVDSVMLRARVLESYPAGFVASLAGLAEARLPVAAPARYGPVSAKPAPPKLTQNATAVDPGTHPNRAVNIFSRAGAPVIAPNDGTIKSIGHTKALGNFVVLEDVYGNRFRASHLGALARAYAVPKQDVTPSRAQVAATAANSQPQDPRPSAPASAGLQPPASNRAPATPPSSRAKVTPRPAARPLPPQPAPQPATYKARNFAHPSRTRSQAAGGFEQLLSEQAGTVAGQTAYDSYSSGVLKLNPKNSKLRPLKQGATVIAGTILGRIDAGHGSQLPHMRFEIQPAGKDSPRIDPAPVLATWKLLAASKIYNRTGKDVLYKPGGELSIGRLLLLPKAQLERYVLSDPRLDIYPAGRRDIQTGQINSRVLIAAEFLAAHGLKPKITSLKSGHSDMTASGNVSEHASGNALDIAALNGVPILGNQGPGGIAEQAIKLLMQLQGPNQADQIISLRSFGANTLALPDHANHIHVGFAPLFSDNKRLGQQTISSLRPRQWDTLIQRIGSLPSPVIPAKPSAAALPGTGRNGN